MSLLELLVIITHDFALHKLRLFFDHPRQLPNYGTQFFPIIFILIQNPLHPFPNTFFPTLENLEGALFLHPYFRDAFSGVHSSITLLTGVLGIAVLESFHVE
jgi:hypothetical protein